MCQKDHQDIHQLVEVDLSVLIEPIVVFAFSVRFAPHVVHVALVVLVVTVLIVIVPVVPAFPVVLPANPQDDELVQKWPVKRDNPHYYQYH